MALQTYHILSISAVLAEHGLMLIQQMEEGSLLYLIAQVRKEYLLWRYTQCLYSPEDTELKAVN